ncbi:MULTISPECIES: CIA30 family protein [unclassified Synechococcus]|uniref:CIA30 family protein n=1 Tax=unclassified Synechococcus TaxID=2626047 RepID=UPI0021A402BC|nr:MULTISPECIES: CIA30 family protein [unclassified Synechococcus]MCT0213879.1 CIA30 family protein [Synechococcus sp. CS-1326]MCT0233455.1 CIA30 family protein [Synechococcus sp. CS-1327]
MRSPMLLVSGDGFSGWLALNDTIMGGSSSGACRVGPEGLVLEAEVVEQGGGFVSCRSPLFSPPLDLGAYRSLQLEVRGDGRRYKLAVACADGLAGLTELIPGGLRWVAEFDTSVLSPDQPAQLVEIGFDQLRASVRARPLNLPLRFDACRVTRLQILHSKFGDDGQLNAGFRAGPLQFSLLAVRALP